MLDRCICHLAKGWGFEVVAAWTRLGFLIWVPRLDLDIGDGT